MDPLPRCGGSGVAPQSFAQGRFPIMCPSCLSIQVAIEAIGNRLGMTLSARISRDHAPMSEPLEIIKFVCKDFWTQVFGKGVDNLRTNHRGTFVLRDVHFVWLAALQPSQARSQVQTPANGVAVEPEAALQPPSRAELAKPYLWLPCALLTGALRALGLEVASVTADASSLPQVDFTIVLHLPAAQGQQQ